MTPFEDRIFFLSGGAGAVINFRYGEFSNPHVFQLSLFVNEEDVQVNLVFTALEISFSRATGERPRQENIVVL